MLSKKQARVLFAVLFAVLLNFSIFLFVYNGPGSVATDTYSGLKQTVGLLPLRNGNPFLLTLLACMTRKATLYIHRKKYASDGKNKLP